jgi:D-inositol-3-phosphate glycosyltransferase
MHYYDIPLCHALAEQGIELTFITCTETEVANSGEFAVRHTFAGIYGSRPMWWRGLNYVRALGSILSFAVTHRPSIAHFHYFLLPPMDLVLLRVLKGAGTKIVMTVHDVIPFDAARNQHRFFRQLYGLADQVIVHTEASKQELIDLAGVDANKVTVIAHGAPSYFAASRSVPMAEAKRALGLSPEAKTILFFGQIKRVKGLDVLIRAFAIVRESFPDSCLLIAGPIWKDDFGPYSQLVAELGLQDNVVIDLRYVPDSEVPIYFHAADVVALPYQRIYQSGVLLMAQAFGRPVVASAVGGLAEVIREGQTGWLVPAGDHTALAGALRRVLADSELAEAVGQRGRQQAEEQYAWPKLASEIRTLYRGVLGQLPSHQGAC